MVYGEMLPRNQVFLAAMHVIGVLSGCCFPLAGGQAWECMCSVRCWPEVVFVLAVLSMRARLTDLLGVMLVEAMTLDCCGSFF
jgi:hypothetical protein